MDVLSFHHQYIGEITSEPGFDKLNVKVLIDGVEHNVVGVEAEPEHNNFWIKVE